MNTIFLLGLVALVMAVSYFGYQQVRIIQSRIDALRARVLLLETEQTRVVESQRERETNEKNE